MTELQIALELQNFHYHHQYPSPCHNAQGGMWAWVPPFLTSQEVHTVATHLSRINVYDFHMGLILLLHLALFSRPWLSTFFIIFIKRKRELRGMVFVSSGLRPHNPYNTQGRWHILFFEFKSMQSLFSIWGSRLGSCGARAREVQ
jgi:hypothetical protein